MSEYLIYTHASMPSTVVVEHQEMYFLVLNIPGGWKQRKPYLGYMESLRTLDPQEGKEIVARIGLGHGGYREGSGRTTTFEEAMQKKTITLPTSYTDYLKELGEGNLSAGIRAAVDLLREKSE